MRSRITHVALLVAAVLAVQPAQATPPPPPAPFDTVASVDYQKYPVADSLAVPSLDTVAVRVIALQVAALDSAAMPVPVPPLAADSTPLSSRHAARPPTERVERSTLNDAANSLNDYAIAWAKGHGTDTATPLRL